ncbi:hypothetical protein OC846_003618 [Tilletia horrida]|uniref:JmjC domain-containing protein n=1 Tax=Tilletia horrida TaxID=155126 RepID=A0AAN6GP41_9BASI|nr:hypothetical protein OC846_003618 [Tilletia horrida]
MSAVPILLASDGISPMAGPSNLPAIHFPRALAEIVSGASSAKAAADQIDTHLKKRGWEPTWHRSDADHLVHHHHHQQRDKVEAQDSNSSAKTTTTTTTATLELQPGDLLLLPAGYTHSALTQSTTPPFMMVGSYPQGAAPWDMQFPTTSAECDKLATSIKDNLLERFRKGLFEAQDPVELSADQGLSQLWDVRSV